VETIENYIQNLKCFCEKIVSGWYEIGD